MDGRPSVSPIPLTTARTLADSSARLLCATTARLPSAPPGARVGRASIVSPNGVRRRHGDRPSDYAANAGTISFVPGDTSETVTVQVNGDATVEANETFNVNLANATGNATIADGQAVGTILNDDRKGEPHTFTLGKPRLNPKRGTARLALTVSGPGKLAISGNGAKVVARSVSAAGTVQLLIKASGTEQRRLSRTGTVTVQPRVTYTPMGGRPITRSTNVRLKKL
jgi:Calx-beta domain